MNSSLLVPAFVVVAVTAVVGVFFSDSLFSGGAGADASDYAVSQSDNFDSSVEIQSPSETETIVSDFSWDDEAEETAAPSGNDGQDSFDSLANVGHSDDAPGEVFGESDEDSRVTVKRKTSPVVLANESAPPIKDGAEEMSFVSRQVDHKQVNHDLDSFFNQPEPTAKADESPKRSAIRKTAKTESVSQPASSSAQESTPSESVDEISNQLALAATEKKDEQLSAFDFGQDSLVVEPRKSSKEEMKSVVAMEPAKKFVESLEPKSISSDAISGDLEPVISGQFNDKPAEKMVRKFKITNPKETTLPVTMSVDGKQITLKPDQTYVIKESDGEVNVTFSRGGSFGFQNQVLKTGHYRFSVTRADGWKLSN